jgi:hypothetical protein
VDSSQRRLVAGCSFIVRGIIGVDHRSCANEFYTRGSKCTDVNGVGRIGPAFVCQVQGRGRTWYLSTTSCSLNQGKPRRPSNPSLLPARTSHSAHGIVVHLQLEPQHRPLSLSRSGRCDRHRRKLIGSIAVASEVNPVRSGRAWGGYLPINQ